MKSIDVQGFEQKFRTDPDPWRYETSSFERTKRRVLLDACGLRFYGRGLELGCANGVASAGIVRRCLALDAVDASATALRLAAARNYAARRPRFIRLDLPAPLPRQRYDLIVVSELAYYLKPRALRELARQLDRALAPGGRIVILHHVTPFGDAAQLPARAQTFLRRFFTARRRRALWRRCGKYEVAAFGR